MAENKLANKKLPEAAEERLTKALSAFESTAKDLLRTQAAATVRLEVSMNSGGITKVKIGLERAV